MSTTEGTYGPCVKRVAKTLVAINEDAQVYSQHVDGLALIAGPLKVLVESFPEYDWKADVLAAIGRELVERGLVEALYCSVCGGNDTWTDARGGPEIGTGWDAAVGAVTCGPCGARARGLVEATS